MLLPAQVIQKKRDGQPLTETEIRAFVTGFTIGQIPDYQMAALAMAICFQGMDFDETMWLTRAMVESGSTINWGQEECQNPQVSGCSSPDSGTFYADKHSTGGIGDKVSLILAPWVAACGLRVPMISGRGLGPTGGTLDKLESIPGFRTNLSLTELRHVTNTVGCCITGATPEIAPADKKLYALRDVTATVSCLPLIVASIMSKKLAENVDALVLDVKWGSGAFMRTRETSAALARAMVEVGKRYGKKVVALQTDMNQPLGQTIGNALEVRECRSILNPAEPVAAGSADLRAVTLALATEMLLLAGVKKTVAAAHQILQKQLATGAALETFDKMVAAQGGDPAAPLPVAKHQRAIAAPQTGWVHAIACDQLGYAVIALGGGRAVASDTIDFAVGFENPKKIGDAVTAGEPLMIMHYQAAARAAQAEQLVQAAYTIAATPAPTTGPLIGQRFE